MKKIFFGFIISIGLFACKDTEVEKYLSQIDTLENTLDSSEMVLNNNKIDSTGLIINNVRERILIVKKNYRSGDTINKEVGNLVDGYKSIRKGLARSGKIPATLQNAIPQAKEDLANLKHDIENGVNEREKYANFIENEKTKVNQITTLLSSFVSTQDKYLKKYDSLHPLMVEFTDNLLTK